MATGNNPRLVAIRRLEKSIDTLDAIAMKTESTAAPGSDEGERSKVRERVEAYRDTAAVIRAILQSIKDRAPGKT